MTIALANLSARFTDAGTIYTGLGLNVYSTGYAAGSYVVKYSFNNTVIYTIDSDGNMSVGGIITAAGIVANTLNATVLNVASLVVSGNSITSVPNIVRNNSTTQITTGYTVQSFDAGANLAAYGTWTPDPANGNYQVANTNGALIIAAPSTNCAIEVLIINGPTTGAITFSGFTVSATTGDTYTTTAVNKYILIIRKIANWATYVWKALQ